ncbi:hypothetical protein EVAR_78432_1 [Eumeta japonica]|uniref:Uncharacterized protein n=1 Tax=Eumeta variegata TaxID=151549 RepID=A0A4C1TYR5_EUMVA|nr:hypothetical protein EVAR_78432_1 [Eumeta japonica]
MVVKAGYGRRKMKVGSMQWRCDRCVVCVECLGKRDVETAMLEMMVCLEGSCSDSLVIERESRAGTGFEIENRIAVGNERGTGIKSVTRIGTDSKMDRYKRNRNTFYIHADEVTCAAEI